MFQIALLVQSPLAQQELLGAGPRRETVFGRSSFATARSRPSQVSAVKMPHQVRSVERSASLRGRSTCVHSCLDAHIEPATVRSIFQRTINLLTNTAQPQYPVQPETGFSTHYNDPPAGLIVTQFFYPRQRLKVTQKLLELSFNYLCSTSP